MAGVTFQVVDGINKGRVFRDLPTPLTIGREEGNHLRLDDERVSRIHARIQSDPDNGEVILTDMESTNGTRVNGTIVTIRRLKIGDQIGVGRSVLLFGSEEQIRTRVAALNTITPTPNEKELPPTVHVGQSIPEFDQDLHFDLNDLTQLKFSNGNLYVGNRMLPQLPARMTPSQTARLSELLEFLHSHLVRATENIQGDDQSGDVKLAFVDWQQILGLQMLLARYVRAINEPDALNG